MNGWLSRLKDAVLVALTLLGFAAAVVAPNLLVWVLLAIAVVYAGRELVDRERLYRQAKARKNGRSEWRA